MGFKGDAVGGVSSGKAGAIMKAVLILMAAAVLVGCKTDSSIMEKLEFKEGQEGCIRAVGDIATGMNPIAQGKLNVNLVKKQGENPPDC